MARLIITGASGFVGRNLLAALEDEHRVFGLARRSELKAGVASHRNLTWFQADIGEGDALKEVFASIRAAGGADILIHLAAHYDFTGEVDDEYWRTNVYGMRNVVELALGMGLRRFIFPSSVAACRYPAAGQSLDETSPPDGDHVYARTKRIGEEMLAAYRDRLPSNVLRLAALFSDWCEYPPLFVLLSTWLSRSWDRRLLAGRGASAIPYLHIRDLVSFVTTLLGRLGEVGSGETLVASCDGAVSHRELFEATCLARWGERRRPILLPRPLCGPGLRLRDAAGRLLGRRPFLRPWMAAHVDRRLAVDGSRSRARLGWAPRPRLGVLRRMPFLVENLRSDPIEWTRRNQAALERVRLRPNLRVCRLLEAHEREICDGFLGSIFGPSGRGRFPAYRAGADAELEWQLRLLLRHLITAVKTAEKGVFVAYCEDLARHHLERDRRLEELCEALAVLSRVSIGVVRADPEAGGLSDEIQAHVSMTLHCGCDRVEEVLDERKPCLVPSQS